MVNCLLCIEPVRFKKLCIYHYRVEYNKKNYNKILQQHKKYYKEHKEKLYECEKKRREINIDKVKEYEHKRYLNNKEKIKIYNIIHKERRKIWFKKYKQERILNDINYKLRITYSARVGLALKYNIKINGIYKKINIKKNKTSKLIGCSWQQFKEYLQNQFKDVMNWNNWAYKGWHIDHIKPLALFDLTKEEEQKKAFHYTNCQPLWRYENLEKGGKVLN